MKALPFGLKGAPGYFNGCIVNALHDLIVADEVRVYIDDIVVGGASYEDFAAQVSEVFRRLRELRLVIKPSKLHIGLASSKIMGLVVGRQATALQQHKIEEMRATPVPARRSSCGP